MYYPLVEKVGGNTDSPTRGCAEEPLPSPFYPTPAPRGDIRKRQATNPRGLLPNPAKNNLATKPNIPSCLSKFHVRSRKLKERAHSRITTTQQHRTKLGFSIKLLRALIQGLLQLSDFTIVLILQNAMSFSTTN